MSDLLASLSTAYADSENPVVSSMRSVTSTVGRLFAETETAKVTRWVKELDPQFTAEGFLRDLREYIVPELVDAYVNGDQVVLRQWCSEAVSPPPSLSPCFSSPRCLCIHADLSLLRHRLIATGIQCDDGHTAAIHLTLSHL